MTCWKAPPAPTTLAGGIGDDTYQVDNASDTVTELSGAGTADRVLTSVSFALAPARRSNSWKPRTQAAPRRSSFAATPWLRRSRATRRRHFLNDGGWGSSNTLIGNGGDDTYAVYNSTDTIIEAAGEGIDRLAAGWTTCWAPE